MCASKQKQKYSDGPETARLIHREFVADDAAVAFRLRSETDVIRYTREIPIESIAAAREAIIAYPDFETTGFGRWACVLKSTGQVIGFCGLKYLPELDAVDIGYRLLPEFWGQGLATEACRATLAFGFETIKLNEIIGLVMPENKASIRVMEKVGMTPEGLIQYDGDDAIKYSMKQDTFFKHSNSDD
jgi:[ribosomal protein S5]-alanine N-acetyltransferase